MLRKSANLMAKLIALKHSVFCKGRAPWEDEKEFEANRKRWREYFSPTDPLLEEAVEEIAMMKWMQRRNRNSTLLFGLCEPFGQIVAQYPGQEWTDVANKLLKKRDEDFISIVGVCKHLQEWAKGSNDAKLQRRILKKLASIDDKLRKIANLNQAGLEFFMGLGEENAKQAERAIQLNASVQKLHTQYFQLEEYVATKNNLRPACIEHVKVIEAKTSASTALDGDGGTVDSGDQPAE